MTQADQKTDEVDDVSKSTDSSESLTHSSETQGSATAGKTSLDDPFFVGAEIDPDQLFEQWAREDARAEVQRAQHQNDRFSVGRQPLLLGLIAVVSAVLSFYCFPALDAVIHEGDFDQCGDVLERALSQSKGEAIRPFYHQQTCRLSGMVGTTNLFAIGFQENPESKDEFERNRGISYVVKLNGGQIYAILPAHPPKVEGYRLRNGSLFGLEFTEVGLIIDPTIATSYRHLERELRVNLGIKSSERLWFFDVSYSPWDHKMPLATAVVAPLIALLALLAIYREMRRRQQLKEQEQEENDWLLAFEAAASESELSGKEERESIAQAHEDESYSTTQSKEG